MMDIRVALWFTWILITHLFQRAAVESKDWLLRGINVMRKSASLWLSLLLLAALVVILPSRAAAQDDDPPGRVARLSFIQGSVSYQPSGDSDWVQADPNRPFTIGDNLWADQDSRAELHIGSTAIRLSAQTGVSILNLDDRTVQLQLAQGEIEVHVRHVVAGDAFEVDTPNLAVQLTQSGEYLIRTNPDDNTTSVVVREGAGQATGSGDSYDLEAGQQYDFSGTDQLAYNNEPAPNFDDFEDWCQSRDQRENASISAQYVSRDVDGVYDLDDYGDWQSVADYGEVWVPRGVAVGWAPYRFGHWVWIAPWGWTWVEAEPWGFAPFHYGRWAFVNDYWAWVPGPVVVRPVYAPALVAFVGGGGMSLSVSFGGGFEGVAWFPLGPRDVWVPGYHCSPRYFQNINVTNTRVVNVTEITNVYNNYTRNVSVVNNYTYAHNAVAVTAVTRDTFVNARPVGKVAVRVTAEQISNVRVAQSAPIAPARTSRVFAEAKPATGKPAVPFAQRPVVAKLAPPTPMKNERPQVYTNESRPFNQPAAQRPNNPPTNERPANTMGNENRPAANEQQPPANRPANNEQQPANRDGFRPFTPPAGQPNSNPNANDRNQPNNRPQQQSDQQPRPPVRYTPPVQAHDNQYDVHPPLNKPQTETQQQPRPQENKPAPPPKTESKPESKPSKPQPHSR
jgi:hypothetical protein